MPPVSASGQERLSTLPEVALSNIILEPISSGSVCDSVTTYLHAISCVVRLVFTRLPIVMHRELHCYFEFVYNYAGSAFLSPPFFKILQPPLYTYMYTHIYFTFTNTYITKPLCSVPQGNVYKSIYSVRWYFASMASWS